MRILAFLFSIFLTVAAGAQVSAPLLLGYEKPEVPKVKRTTNAPEIEYYCGETSMSLQALNFESRQTVTKSLLRPSYQRIDDPVFRGFRKHFLRNYLEALPRIQMLLHVRDQLPGILMAYNEQTGVGGVLSEYLIKALTRTELHRLGADDTGIFSNYNVMFDYDSTGKFQVAGIEVNRLAVNTGYDIHFNVNGLLQLKDFTIADAVQLWLHEMLHNMHTVSLEGRDKWGAGVAAWVKQYSNEFEVSKDRKVMTVLLPAKVRSKDKEYIRDRLNDFYRNSVMQRFFILDQSKSQTKLLTKIYDGFASFNNEVKNKVPDSFSSTKMEFWPEIAVSDVRRVGPSSLRVEYKQSHLYFDTFQQTVSKSGDGHGIGYQGSEAPPSSQFRIDMNLETSDLETTRNYSSRLEPDDFEIYRIQDVGEKRFVSLRIRTQNMKDLLVARKIHLLGKNGADGAQLSFEGSRARVLNKEEMLVQIEVPRHRMILNQVLVPVIGAKGEYQERLIRSSQPVTLLGSLTSLDSKSHVKSVIIEPRVVESDKLKIKIETTETKPIKGITFDLEHRANTYSYKLEMRSYAQMVPTLVGTTHLGRKYYMQKKEIKQSSDGKVEFVVPLAIISRTLDGPPIRRLISRDYSEVYQEKDLPYVEDSLHRRLINLWIHYEDGTVEKVDSSRLPEDRFSMQSEEEIQRQARERYEAVMRYYDQFDGYTKPSSPVTCEGLF